MQDTFHSTDNLLDEKLVWQSLWVFAAVAAIVLLGSYFIFIHVAMSQSNNRPSAEILKFEATSDTASVYFAWNTSHINAKTSIHLEAYTNGQWVALNHEASLADDGTLRIERNTEITPTTYRLILRNAQGVIMQQAFVSVDGILPQ